MLPFSFHFPPRLKPSPVSLPHPPFISATPPIFPTSFSASPPHFLWLSSLFLPLTPPPFFLCTPLPLLCLPSWGPVRVGVEDGNGSRVRWLGWGLGWGGGEDILAIYVSGVSVCLRVAEAAVVAVLPAAGIHLEPESTFTHCPAFAMPPFQMQMITLLPWNPRKNPK